MKLNEMNFDVLSDKELVLISLKYKLIEKKDIPLTTRNKLLRLIKDFLQRKLQTYGQRQRRHSVSSNIQKQTINNTKTIETVPQPRAQKQRRMSHPITNIEKVDAKETLQINKTRHDAQEEVIKAIQPMNPQYDMVGMYPPVKRLVAVGDLHGDLRVTIMALQLAEVIPQNCSQTDIDNIHWSGGSSWLIQLGDQIDRCRPDDWEKNCIKDLSDVVEDEGSNMAIIRLMLRLDDEAKKVGGRVLGLLGNHELMNVDKDFRYVSPAEFMEFVPEKDRTSTYTEDGYPLGYYHRKKAFERGSNLSKVYAVKKKSITTVGSFVFVHGGLSLDLANKYTIPEINTVISKWLINQSNTAEEKIFDEIFRDDDDMSPFWCRIFAEEDGYGDNTEQKFNELLSIINKRNKLLMPVKGMVIAHTPQFMDNKYLNSTYNDRLWRIDVGMSRAFGKHRDCGEDKYRQIQVLVIHDNERFEVRKRPFNTDRYPSSNMGENVSITNERMPF
jgi:hypothetical protein